MLLKTKYYPRQILLAVRPCDGSTIYDQIYVVENLSLANHVDLVSIDTQGRQWKYERFGNIFMLLVLFTDFWQLTGLIDEILDVRPYKIYNESNAKCIF